MVAKAEIGEVDTIKERKEALIMEETINLHRTRMASNRTIIEKAK